MAAVAAAELGLDFSRGGVVPSLEFAFNSAHFSDRELRLEIVASESGGGSIADEEHHQRKVLLQEKTFYINSAILASRSSFFLKLFSNGMKESAQTHSAIRIADSEENALMELLRYMYGGKLTATEPTLLLDILMVADKFGVLSCMRHCSRLLTSLPMSTTESALLYIDYPCSASLASEVQRVIRVAKELLANKYMDFEKFALEMMDFPLVGIEAIFSSMGLQVLTEGNIYTFMLTWARARYPALDERREILTCRLLPLVRFNHMTRAALQDILARTDDDIDHEQVTERITEVLLRKAHPTQMEGALKSRGQFAERGYHFKPVELVVLHPCRPEFAVYLDLTFEECSRLFPSGDIFSHPFQLEGWELYLMATCTIDEQSKLYSFGLWLVVTRNLKGSKYLRVRYRIDARTRSSGKFERAFNDQNTFTGDGITGCSDLFDIPWSTFLADDNLFIDGVLHLKVYFL
ncbi:BTB/POZ domain-containing protein POB1-like [Triticum dicoccoides]|uniref:BTB/POZ domain-containing protein POB1-like n=1 Tax=Triticum dicoccoides TaxID=85692 RepID=UPI00189145FA|nr:BTB/POZ domain-containing protein POB1-like [Triticum dicoccoides]